jgi:hypothetical protein
MAWATREDVRIGRIACTWLIKRFLEPGAEIRYVPPEQIGPAVEAGAKTFHVPDGDFVHADGKTPFEAMLAASGLEAKDPALALMGRYVNGADTDNSLYHQPEGPGLRAVSEGFRLLHPGDDRAVIDAMLPVFDALYALARASASPM